MRPYLLPLLPSLGLAFFGRAVVLVLPCEGRRSRRCARRSGRCNALPRHWRQKLGGKRLRDFISLQPGHSPYISATLRFLPPGFASASRMASRMLRRMSSSERGASCAAPGGADLAGSPRGMLPRRIQPRGRCVACVKPGAAQSSSSALCASVLQLLANQLSGTRSAARRQRLRRRLCVGPVV